MVDVQATTSSVYHGPAVPADVLADPPPPVEVQGLPDDVAHEINAATTNTARADVICRGIDFAANEGQRLEMLGMLAPYVAPTFAAVKTIVSTFPSENGKIRAALTLLQRDDRTMTPDDAAKMLLEVFPKEPFRLIAFVALCDRMQLTPETLDAFLVKVFTRPQTRVDAAAAAFQKTQFVLDKQNRIWAQPVDPTLMQRVGGFFEGAVHGLLKRSPMLLPIATLGVCASVAGAAYIGYSPLAFIQSVLAAMGFTSDLAVQGTQLGLVALTSGVVAAMPPAVMGARYPMHQVR